MTGTLITLLVFVGTTVALGFLSGKVSSSPHWSSQVKTAIHVSFIVFVVLTVLFVLRVVARTFALWGIR